MPKYKVDVQPAILKKPLVEQLLRMAAYCRVSTNSHEQLGSLETQTKYYTNYIRKQVTGHSPGFIQTAPLVSA